MNDDVLETIVYTSVLIISLTISTGALLALLIKLYY